MIERRFVEDKTKELRVMDWLKRELSGMGYSRAELEKTPLGMKVIIYSFKPGMIVGRAGSNIERLAKILEEKFKLESPHIEVREIDNPNMDPQIMANNIARQLSIYGVTKFKAIGHRNLARIMDAGAIGAEIIMSGRIPSSRARSWRFYAGYLPKCGETAKNDVLVGFRKEKLKMGVIGVTVRILPPYVQMPDRVELKNIEIKGEEIKGEETEQEKEGKKGEKEERKKGKEENGKETQKKKQSEKK